jgi:hypothetical protein
MWASASFTGSRVAPNWLFDYVALRTKTTLYGNDRVLNLVLLGGVEVFPIIYNMKPRVKEWSC